ncbi:MULTISPECIES: hypothetical protein [Aliiglaciecola]|uniref:hypothetical protein n=1 Tax=Aliiglaciecola TaxID=1406885 RepID=UPI001C0A6654|nr:MULTISPECIES: hypothetical protein [Aliiglaciecola]MBU2879875.1 hypothetical protein [Aliiglaciecola lipolytica]MDO6709846.1 hypothetical protein [Aliiglaciecola sp. 2_MG-2023]MDO6750994.1 hypothetical protein [Aliiglaciecola sp. 1_MG-2023]
MNEPTPKPLSKYQAAMLTHMGIVPWQLKTNSQDVAQLDSEVTTQSNVSSSALQLPSQEQKQAGLQRLRQQIESKRKSANNGLLLCMPETANNQLLADLLLYADLSITHCIFEENADPNDYVDFKLAWQVGDKLSLNGLVLTAPTPDKINSSQDKRQLWRILHQVF